MRIHSWWCAAIEGVSTHNHITLYFHIRLILYRISWCHMLHEKYRMCIDEAVTIADYQTGPYLEGFQHNRSCLHRLRWSTADYTIPEPCCIDHTRQSQSLGHLRQRPRSHVCPHTLRCTPQQAAYTKWREREMEARQAGQMKGSREEGGEKAIRTHKFTLST